MNAFEKILSEIDKGIKTIEPLMKWGTRQIAESQIIGLEEAKKIVEKYKGNTGWIPVEQRFPDDDDFILLSVYNFSIPMIGRYEEVEDGGGSFYLGDCDEDDTCMANNLFGNAWMPLPEPYRPEEDK